jgi:hypothetical protein
MFQAKFKSQAQHFPITSSNIPSKNDKAVNVNQLVSHVLDYQKPKKHINHIKKNKRIKMYNYVYITKTGFELYMYNSKRNQVIHV